jgi:hypothetical protein
MPFVGNSGQVNTLYEKNESSPGTSVRIVSGEVGTEISASGGLNLSIPLSTVTQVGNVTNDIVSFTNPQTGITVSSNAHVGGNMSAGYYYGDGSNLVGVSATTISPGASLSVNQVTTSGDLIVGGLAQLGQIIRLFMLEVVELLHLCCVRLLSVKISIHWYIISDLQLHQDYTLTNS